MTPSLRLVLVVSLLCGCDGTVSTAPTLPAPAETAAPAEATAPASSPASSRRALVIGIDGLRPDALTAAQTPHLDALFAGGRATHRGTTQLEGATSSAPGWASVLTGVDAEEHGVLRNGDEHGIRLVRHPTFLGRALRAGRRVFVATEDPAVMVMLEPAVAESAFEGPGARVASVAAARLTEADVDVAFVVFEGVDDAGHATGFSASNPAYLAAIERIDAYTGALLGALRARPDFTSERWLVVVVSDHSGVGHGHGPRRRAYQTVPLAYASPLLTASELGESHRSHTQVADAVLAWLQGAQSDVLGVVADE